MPFFNPQSSKRKLSSKRKSSSTRKKSKPAKNIVETARNDPEIESESDDEIVHDRRELSSEDEDALLTVQEKRLKLARKYIEQASSKGDDVLKTIRDEELERAGKLKKKVADSIEINYDNKRILTCKQHKLAITCTKLSWDNRFLYSASKDGAIVKWSLEDFSKVKFIAFKSKKSRADGAKRKCHEDTINCLAVSSDNKYLISGDDGGTIIVWRTEDLEFVKSFDGHKSAILDLAVCPSTNSLFSTSKDLLVKVWNLNEMGYMETLFGHQAPVTSVEILNADRVITAGGTDKTIRIWKIQEESQLVFNGHAGSIDIVRKLDEGFFISGGDDGCLCLWGTLKKRPLHTEREAHGLCPTNDQPNWISALAVLPNSDLIASGSCNGCIAFWKWTQGSKVFSLLRTVDVEGYINSLHFTSDMKYLIVGIGREHRLGRWRTIDNIKNSIICIPLELRTTNQSS